VQFRILGPLEVLERDAARALGGAKQRAVLAILLLHRGEVLSSERVIDELWGERPPATAAKTLQGYVSHLRKALGGGLLNTRGRGYQLTLAPDQVDVDQFERLAAEGRGALSDGDAATAAERLRQALGLWRGPALVDFAYEAFAQAEIARLEEARLAALEDRVDADLALGRHAEVVGALEALIVEQPYRERLRAQLMLALYRCDRQVDALQAYQNARHALVGELGIEPGERLRELEGAILAQDPALGFAPRSQAAARPAAETPRGVFVGRGPELAELVGGLDDAFAGRGRLFLLAGEPGIGKSRLAEELAVHARARDARVLVGRCWEAGGAPAYWPWVQSLRTYVRESDTAALRSQLGAGAADLAQLIPELRQRFQDLPQPASSGSEGARFSLFDAATEFLRNASRGRPLLLILDDLHAADAPSLLLLRFLTRELGSIRMLLLGVYRDVDPIPAAPLTEMLAEVAREPLTRRLSLGGLSEREVAEYVELTASEIASSELVAGLHEETAGNPLFVGEMVRLLTADGVESESSRNVRLAIPQTVRDVIVRRLGHLSQECNRVLVLASVIGREFALDALARVAGVSEDELLDTLDEAMAVRVVSDVPGGPGRLRFAHVLIRDTLYEGLTAARRVRLHRRAVEALEPLYGDEPGQHLAELAQHSISGKDFEKALHYARRAGDRALALLAYEEAARLYQMALDALELLDPDDETARCELLLSLGEAEIRAGNSSVAKERFLDAAGIARRVGLSLELARAAAGYGGRIVWARAEGDDRLVPLLEEGLAALADEDVELRARLLARLAGALRDEPSRERRDTLSSEAVELARHTGNPAGLAYALDGRAAAMHGPDTVAECLALGTELREVAARIGDRERVVAGHVLRIIAQLTVGDIREAKVDLAAASRIADELRQPAQLWQTTSTQALLALAAGRLTEAEALIPQAFAFGERALPEGAIPIYRLQRYTLFDFLGRLEEVEAEICDLVAEYPARPIFRCALAHLDARLGRTAEAKRALDHLAGEDFSALPFDQEWLYGMSLLAETSSLVGDKNSAVVLYRLLVPWSAFNAVDVGEGFRGSVSRYLGLLAATTKRSQDAELHYEHALQSNAEMGAHPWVAHTQDDYARLLLSHNERGDRERALELIGGALTTYRELGMESWAKSASELEQTLRGAPAAGR
jgi:DNA-binding SARP family transcriptional activator